MNPIGLLDSCESCLVLAARDIFVRDALERGAAVVPPRSCNYKDISVLLATWAPQENS